MKNWIPVLFLAVLFLSCSRDEIDFEAINIVGETYTHEIPNCNDGGNGNPEINCTEFVTFIDEARADVLAGGSDIVSRLNYSRSGDKIILEQGDGINFDISFRIQDGGRLIRLEDNSTWVLEPN